MSAENSIMDSEADTPFMKDLRGLPYEVLVMIFEMLPATTLYMLLHSTSWIKQIVQSVRVISCAGCSFISGLQLKILQKSIGSHLRRLYLDNLVSVKSVELRSLICRCKRLKILSVKNSGMYIQHLHSILQNLELEVIYFTINPSNGHCLNQLKKTKELQFERLRKMHVEVGDLSLFHYFISCFLPYCSKLTELEMNFSVVHQNPGFLDHEMEEQTQLNLPHLNALTVAWPRGTGIISEVSNIFKERRLAPMLEWLFTHRAAKTRWKKFWITDPHLTGIILEKCRSKPENFIFASCLFIDEEVVDGLNFDILERLPQNSVEQLGFCTTDLEQSHVHQIQRACGSKLKLLTAVKASRDQRFVKVNLLRQIFESCIHIVDLDISGIHVTDHNVPVCSAISRLKGLQRLCLPACAIAYIPDDASPSFPSDEASSSSSPRAKKRMRRHYTGYQKAFEAFSQMVQSCDLVEDFDLNGCGTRCIESMYGSEYIISNLYKWKRLKHLSMNNCRFMDSITFIEDVASYCDEFTSLDLVNIGHELVFLFMTSIIKVLELSKSFTFLRIVHHSFLWYDASFWKAVAGARMLQGLCITSDANAYANEKLVIGALAQLPRFHVFHLYSKSSYLEDKSLRKKLKALMSKTTNYRMFTDNVNLIFGKSYFSRPHGRTFEHHCHMFHPGTQDISTNGPWFS